MFAQNLSSGIRNTAPMAPVLQPQFHLPPHTKPMPCALATWDKLSSLDTPGRFTPPGLCLCNSFWLEFLSWLHIHALLLVTHVCVLNQFSYVQLFEVPWTVARQASKSMGLSRQVSIPSSRGSSNPGIEPASPGTPPLQSDYLLLCHRGSLLIPHPALKKHAASAASSMEHSWLAIWPSTLFMPIWLPEGKEPCPTFCVFSI